jgi:pilus assembly protein FimV
MARASLEEFTRIEERGDEALQVSGGAVAAAAASGAAPGLVVETAVEQGRAEEAGVDILQAEDDEIDVLAEADVYFAYRRFDKAEELLREALKDEPGRRDLAAKLLEVYAASGNGEAFVREATALKAGLEPGDASMWDKIAAMGRRVAPGHALFEPAAAPAAAAAKPAAQAENSLSLHELTDIDFEKELGALDDQPVTAVSAAAAQASGENELADLDLTLDEATLARLRQPDGGAIESSVTSTLNAGQVPFAGEPKAKAAEGGAGDIDWLSAAGEDLLKFEDDVQGESESTLISGEDEVDTKLDLAKAYIDMGDQESARNILNEVANEGDQNQQREAHDLMRQIG